MNTANRQPPTADSGRGLIAIMWLLAIGVLGAAWVIIAHRRGLVWEALGRTPHCSRS